MGLYLDNGYFNVEYVLSKHQTFNFIIGGRGTGKTYGVLKYMIENNKKFILMRRTQTQLDSICNRDLSPIKPINADLGVNVQPYPMGKNTFKFLHESIDDDGKIIQGLPIAYAIALSTVSNLRGFSAADAEYLVYDEFIPEKHERPIKEECLAFLNCIETINRNRELAGRPAITVLCLANANDFNNPLFIGLKFVRAVEKLVISGKQEYINPQRSTAIFMLTDSPISKQKQNTALYQLKNAAFSSMAISNVFGNFDSPDIISKPLAEYKPVFIIGELCIYKHKSNNTYYTTSHKSGTVPDYPPSREGANNIRTYHRNILAAVLLGKMLYETRFDKALLNTYLTM